MVAALRLSRRWEMWDMSSPRDPRRTDLCEDTGQGGKSRVKTPSKLHIIPESIFYPKFPIHRLDAYTVVLHLSTKICHLK